jgi:hypothetical protein
MEGGVAAVDRSEIWADLRADGFSLHHLPPGRLARFLQVPLIYLDLILILILID